jgi:Zn-dependent peptidase ImmA (M78 family)
MVLDDMLFVATLLTQGPVESKPNLRQGDIRLAGLLVVEGAPRIWFEQYDPLVRQRFSIAHELGHYVLHLPHVQRTFHRCSQNDVDREETLLDGETLSIEQEADAFAGAFLMNADDVRADLAQFGRCVAFLAERYSVSEAAMRRRLRTLEILTQ